MKNNQIQIILGANLSFSGSSEISSFFIGCGFAEHDLLRTYNIIPNLMYISFGIILSQFYIKLSRQEHQIERYPEVLRFQPIPTFIFPLQSL